MDERRPKRKRKPTLFAGKCPECQKEIPLNVCLDDDDQEDAILQHVLQCSALAKQHPVVDSKPSPSVDSDLLMDTKPSANHAPTDVQKEEPPVTMKFFAIKTASTENPANKRFRSSSPATTSTAPNSSQEDPYHEYIASLNDGHFLKQAWWKRQKKGKQKRKQKKRDPGSRPLSYATISSFDLQQCVQVAPEEDKEEARQVSGLRSRGRDESLKLACPICGKIFKSTLIAPVSEEQIGRHVERCMMKQVKEGKQLLLKRPPITTAVTSKSAAQKSKPVRHDPITFPPSPGVRAEQEIRQKSMKNLVGNYGMILTLVAMATTALGGE